MISGKQINPDAPVVCSKNGQFATVDHMEGSDTIKLKKDEHGQHHFIPLSWVTKVDDKVHIGRPGDQAMKEWSTSANLKSTAGLTSAADEGVKNASTAGKKTMKVSETPEFVVPHSGASGREGQKNKGNARPNH